MSARESCIAYILQANIGDPCSLAVMDVENGVYHEFPISTVAMSRIAAETSMKVNAAIAGTDLLAATQEALRSVMGIK